VKFKIFDHPERTVVSPASSAATGPDRGVELAVEGDRRDREHDPGRTISRSRRDRRR
jgi:hypothetical protein